MRRPPPAAVEAAVPITGAEFACLCECLGPFEPEPRLAIAVSGGPDSTALALLARDWVRARRGSLLGLVVDHGLRTESTAEAGLVVGRLARLGIESRILTWEGPKPTSGIQAAAREARLTLLIKACHDAGILHLMFGHHREDQAETVAIRGDRGSGPDGRAGMAAAREMPGLQLLRPLLGVPKARLAATLEQAGVPWLVDPSNRDERFGRGRLRRDQAFAVEAMWEEALACAQSREAGDRRLAQELAHLIRLDPLGYVAVARAGWETLAPGLRPVLLARLLTTVGGRRYPAATRTLERLAAEFGRTVRTAGGCIIVPRCEEILVCREPARIRHRLSLDPGSTAMWDGRYSVSVHVAVPSVEIRALGPDGVALLSPGALEASRSAFQPAVALHALPSAWADGWLVACPPLGALGLPRSLDFSVSAALRPVYPLTAASFAGVNVVSNPQPPIYRLRAGPEPGAEVPSPCRRMGCTVQP